MLARPISLLLQTIVLSASLSTFVVAKPAVLDSADYAHYVTKFNSLDEASADGFIPTHSVKRFRLKQKWPTE